MLGKVDGALVAASLGPSNNVTLVGRLGNMLGSCDGHRVDRHGRGGEWAEDGRAKVLCAKSKRKRLPHGQKNRRRLRPIRAELKLLKWVEELELELLEHAEHGGGSSRSSGCSSC